MQSELWEKGYNFKQGTRKCNQKCNLGYCSNMPNPYQDPSAFSKEPTGLKGPRSSFAPSKSVQNPNIHNMSLPYVYQSITNSLFTNHDQVSRCRTLIRSLQCPLKPNPDLEVMDILQADRLAFQISGRFLRKFNNWAKNLDNNLWSNTFYLEI